MLEALVVHEGPKLFPSSAAWFQTGLLAVMGKLTRHLRMRVALAKRQDFFGTVLQANHIKPMPLLERMQHLVDGLAAGCPTPTLVNRQMAAGSGASQKGLCCAGPSATVPRGACERHRGGQ